LGCKTISIEGNHNTIKFLEASVGINQWLERAVLINAVASNETSVNFDGWSAYQGLGKKSTSVALKDVVNDKSIVYMINSLDGFNQHNILNFWFEFTFCLYNKYLFAEYVQIWKNIFSSGYTCYVSKFPTVLLDDSTVSDWQNKVKHECNVRRRTLNMTYCQENIFCTQHNGLLVCHPNLRSNVCFLSVPESLMYQH
jgi:hypothetical protein